MKPKTTLDLQIIAKIVSPDNKFCKLCRLEERIIDGKKIKTLVVVAQSGKER